MERASDAWLAGAQPQSNQRAVLATQPYSANSATQVQLRVRELNEQSPFCDHLLRLSPADRYQRFGTCITDDGIRAYVCENKHGLRLFYGVLEHDTVRGVVEARQSTDTPLQLEIGVTIESAWRGLGYGTELVLKSLGGARLAGFTSVIAIIGRSNRDTIAIARKLGARIDSLHDCVVAEWQLTMIQSEPLDRAGLRSEPMRHKRAAAIAL